MASTIAECYFLDVGQGAAQVIYLADGSAIVIDCGPSYLILGDLLERRLRVDRIPVLVLSHNHADHVGGVVGLVKRFGRAIGDIYFLQDRCAKEMEALKYYSFLKAEREAGKIPEPVPLVKSSQHHCIYRGNGTPALCLEVLFPNFYQNISGQASGRQNDTSAILLLSCGNRRVLFPGDAGVDVWHRILKDRGGQPVKCDVVAVPHHGGQIVRHKRQNETEEEFHAAIRPDLEWLYSKALNAQTAIVSVGTAPKYREQHPHPPQISAARQSGACTMCTQITKRCSDDLERLRPGVIDPRPLPAQSKRDPAFTSEGESRDVACAGTVLVQIGPNEVEVPRQQELHDAIDSKLTTPSDHPLCRET